jgi:glutamate synthase (NADPH/NADH) small chain
VVIGGGDTAMDCLRTAIRYGAHKAVCIYRRGLGDMPCSQREYANAVEEGSEFVFCAVPLAVLGNDRGEVIGLRLIRTELSVAEPGQKHPFRTQTGTDLELEADWIIPALGFEPEACPETGDFTALARNQWGGIQVDANQMTSLPAVFAGGDIVHGPSPILHAVRDARKAAAQIHAYLSVHRKGASRAPEPATSTLK